MLGQAPGAELTWSVVGLSLLRVSGSSRPNLWRMGMARRPALGDSSGMESTTSSRAPRSFPRPRTPQRTHAAPAGDPLSLRPRPGRCEKDVDSGETGTDEFAPPR